MFLSAIWAGQNPGIFLILTVSWSFWTNFESRGRRGDGLVSNLARYIRKPTCTVFVVYSLLLQRIFMVRPQHTDCHCRFSGLSITINSYSTMVLRIFVSAIMTYLVLD